jgi:chaperone modulatory protein CbpM
MSKRRKVSLTAVILEVDVELSLTQMCEACSVESEEVIKLVEEGVLEPLGSDTDRWRFPGISLQRARMALRLQQDLGVNVAGAALALDLLDELNKLRTDLKRYAQVV